MYCVHTQTRAHTHFSYTHTRCSALHATSKRGSKGQRSGERERTPEQEREVNREPVGESVRRLLARRTLILTGRCWGGAWREAWREERARGTGGDPGRSWKRGTWTSYFGCGLRPGRGWRERGGEMGELAEVRLDWIGLRCEGPGARQTDGRRHGGTRGGERGKTEATETTQYST